MTMEAVFIHTPVISVRYFKGFIIEEYCGNFRYWLTIIFGVHWHLSGDLLLAKKIQHTSFFSLK
jgi:hypothetical protein